MSEFMLNVSKKIGDDIITARSNESVADLLDNLQLLMTEMKARNLVADPNAKEYDEFEAGKLFAEKVVKDGAEKTYWKVSGLEGQFPKWPVTVWPEVLEATGMVVDKLDPNTIYDLANYVAKYVKNDKGNPKKVVELVRPADGPQPPSDDLPF